MTLCFNWNVVATTFIFLIFKLLNTFEILLEIKTGRKNLSFKALYLKDLNKKWKWTFFIYYFDNSSNSLYINGINKKLIAEVSLEKIINRAYKKENKKNKKPKVFYFTKHDDFIYIDKIELKAIRNSNLEITELLISESKHFY